MALIFGNGLHMILARLATAAPRAVTAVMLGLCAGRCSAAFAGRVDAFLRYLCEPVDASEGGDSIPAGELRGRAILEALPSASAWLRTSVATIKKGP
eukprot:scaffold96505_cov43-Prasinocladus_malaysianus.AAC.1